MIIAKEKEVEQLPDDVIELRELREAELMRIYHLERSNEEIAQALESDEDEELRQAITDNIEAIRVKQERIDEINKWIRQITNARASLVNTAAQQAAATPATDFPDGLAL